MSYELDNDCYFRIYQGRDDLWGVVEMQWFDEGDYHEDRFLRDESGERYRFDDEEAAKEFMYDKVKTEFIRPSDLPQKHYLR